VKERENGEKILKNRKRMRKREREKVNGVKILKDREREKERQTERQRKG
jgi:hypothetical protein